MDNTGETPKRIGRLGPYVWCEKSGTWGLMDNKRNIFCFKPNMFLKEYIYIYTVIY